MEIFHKLSALALSIWITLCIFSSCADKVTPPSDNLNVDAPSDVLSIAYVFDCEENAGEWYDVSASQALSDHAKSIGAVYIEYLPSDDTTEARLEAMSSAVEGGANIVVCAGYFSFLAALEAQDMYPDVAFLCIGDAEPYEVNGESLSKNTHCIVFCDEDAGYLAGYIALSEGSVTPGFCSFYENEQSSSVFSGFIQGVSDAARALGRENVNVVCGREAIFDVSEDSDGNSVMTDLLPETVFSEGADTLAVGAAQFSYAVTAARIYDGTVIPICYVPEDKSGFEMPYPVYDYGSAAVSALRRFCENGASWSVRDAGTCSKVGIAEDALDVMFDRVKSSSFTRGDFDEIVSSFKRGETIISGAEKMSDVKEDNVKIVFVN